MPDLDVEYQRNNANAAKLETVKHCSALFSPPFNLKSKNFPHSSFL